MTDYFGAGMRLYLDRLVDWKELLELRKGGAVDAPAEVAAYRTLLETAAKLAKSFERTARENWHLENVEPYSLGGRICSDPAPPLTSPMSNSEMRSVRPASNGFTRAR